MYGTMNIKFITSVYAVLSNNGDIRVWSVQMCTCLPTFNWQHFWNIVPYCMCFCKN